MSTEATFYEGVGERIRAARLLRGWSQLRLGTELGVTAVAVHQWEHAKNRPSLYVLRRIERALGTDVTV